MHDVLATMELEEELKMPEKICPYHSNGGMGKVGNKSVQFGFERVCQHIEEVTFTSSKTRK